MSKTVGGLALNEQTTLPTSGLNTHVPVSVTPVVVFPKEVIGHGAMAPFCSAHLRHSLSPL